MICSIMASCGGADIRMYAMIALRRKKFCDSTADILRRPDFTPSGRGEKPRRMLLLLSFRPATQRVTFSSRASITLSYMSLLLYR